MAATGAAALSASMIHCGARTQAIDAATLASSLEPINVDRPPGARMVESFDYACERPATVP